MKSHSILALLLPLAACHAPRGNSNEYQGGGATLAIQASEENRALASEIVIQNPRETRRDGRKIVEFELRNTTSGGRRFAWAVDWYDTRGFLIDDGTRVWEPVSLPGNGSTTIHLVAPRPEADSWRLQVTRNDDIR